ncbi:MAG TPA: SGNH/GDSL hydrolase family protein [Burkholderiaceae bacterium]|nr:SGNH/GDSL hydrolase family protein [Burkholderiaceae bacterium]HQR69423.1 SGNH/GDSL hydrolase family protein [Burkholderiaceae bacterium]
MSDFSRNAARFSAVIAATLFLVSCGGSDNTPDPQPFASAVAVIGASGADIGNRCGSADPLCFPAPPYAGKSTAANGMLYPQLVAARYGVTLVASSSGGLDFAVGGATTGVIPTDTVAQKLPNMQVQLEQYLQKVGYVVNPQHLVIVDGTTFGNNVRRVLELLAANPSAAATLPTAAVTQAATDIATLLNRLYAAGARNILLANATNMGLHPAVVGLGAQAVALATGMSSGYNGALAAQVLPAVKAVSPGLSIFVVDFWALSNEIKTSPGNFGITNTSAPCYPFFTAPTAPVCATPDTYMFWDELHPSAAVHNFGAQRAIVAIGR